MKVVFVIASVAVLAVRPAHADQCEWLEEPSTARRAVRELATHPELVELCEPCGDAAPGAPRRASKVTVRSVDGHSEVAIDGRTVDLAYIYVKISDGLYRNLAMLAGCPTTGVSPRLRVEPATSTGVLIRADPAPVLPAPALSHREPPAPAPPAEPRAAPSYGCPPPRDDGSPWRTAIVLALGLGALVGWGMWRRRPSHEPRATNLRPRD
jgi:hypothetical protein